MVTDTLKKRKEKNDKKRLLTTGDVARIYGVHPNTIRRWCTQGKIKPYRIDPDGRRLFRREDMAIDYLYRAIQRYLGRK
jgi:excisionase family DNA binding protein